MNAKEQLALWVKGESVHNDEAYYRVEYEDGTTSELIPIKGGECCPDLSCCGAPLADLADREAFVEAYNSGNQDKMTALCTKFVLVMLKHRMDTNQGFQANPSTSSSLVFRMLAGSLTGGGKNSL